MTRGGGSDARKERPAAPIGESVVSLAPARSRTMNKRTPLVTGATLKACEPPGVRNSISSPGRVPWRFANDSESATASSFATA